MVFKLTIQIIVLIITLLIDAYQVERFLLILKKQKKTFELKPKYLLLGSIRKTHISSISGFSLIPTAIWLVDLYWGEPLVFFPLATVAILSMWMLGNVNQYLLLNIIYGK